VTALAIGLALAALPVGWALVALTAVILTVLAFVEPMVGLAAALVIGPLKPLEIYLPVHLPLDAGQIVLLVTLAAWFAHTVAHRRRLLPAGPLLVPLLIFVGAASLSLPSALSMGDALTELAKWAQMILVMVLVVRQADTARWRWHTIIAIVLGVATFQALVGIWQFAFKGSGPAHFEILGRFYRAYGSFEQPNPYGGFMSIGLLLAAGLAIFAAEQALRERTLAAVGRLTGPVGLCALLGAALVMSWSRGAWLGAAAGGLAILLAWPRRWWVGVGLVAGGAAVGLLALQMGALPASVADRLMGFTELTQTFDVRGVDITSANYAVTERLAHWQAAQEMARFHPWVGIGFGNYAAVYPDYALMNWPEPLGHAHNYYLNLLAEIGVIGLAAYLALWVVVIAVTWRTTRRSEGLPRAMALGLLGVWVYLCVHQMVDYLYVANLHMHFGALLGVLAILAMRAGVQEKTEQNRRHGEA